MATEKKVTAPAKSAAKPVAAKPAVSKPAAAKPVAAKAPAKKVEVKAEVKTVPAKPAAAAKPIAAKPVAKTPVKAAAPAKRVEAKAEVKAAPAKAPAAKPAAKKAYPQVKVTLIKSPSHQLEKAKRTVQALGFKKLGEVRMLNDIPATQGMLFRVRHLVKVEKI